MQGERGPGAGNKKFEEDGENVVPTLRLGPACARTHQCRLSLIAALFARRPKPGPCLEPPAPTGAPRGRRPTAPPDA